MYVCVNLIVALICVSFKGLEFIQLLIKKKIRNDLYYFNVLKHTILLRIAVN